MLVSRGLQGYFYIFLLFYTPLVLHPTLPDPLAPLGERELNSRMWPHDFICQWRVVGSFGFGVNW
jgi:hypothetical protein